MNRYPLRLDSVPRRATGVSPSKGLPGMGFCTFERKLLTSRKPCCQAPHDRWHPPAHFWSTSRDITIRHTYTFERSIPYDFD